MPNRVAFPARWEGSTRRIVQGRRKRLAPWDRSPRGAVRDASTAPCRRGAATAAAVTVFRSAPSAPGRLPRDRVYQVRADEGDPRDRIAVMSAAGAMLFLAMDGMRALAATLAVAMRLLQLRTADAQARKTAAGHAVRGTALCDAMIDPALCVAAIAVLWLLPVFAMSPMGDHLNRQGWPSPPTTFQGRAADYSGAVESSSFSTLASTIRCTSLVPS